LRALVVQGLRVLQWVRGDKECGLLGVVHAMRGERESGYSGWATAMKTRKQWDEREAERDAKSVVKSQCG
jgi:hypothetical protein